MIQMSRITPADISLVKRNVSFRKVVFKADSPLDESNVPEQRQDRKMISS